MRKLISVAAILIGTGEISPMIKQGGGAIVNLSSVAGLIGFPGLSPYVASKHAINGLTKNAALEYSKFGSIAPAKAALRDTIEE